MAEPSRRKLLLTTDAVGGVWTYSMDLARGLSEMGFDIVLAVLGPPPGAERQAAAHAVPRLDLVLTGLPLDWMANSRAEIDASSRAIAQLADDAGADVIQLHTPALGVALEPERNIVAVQHSCLATWWRAVWGDEPMPRDFAWRTDCIAEGLARATLAVAPSIAFAKAVMETYSLPVHPLVVYNGRRLAAETATQPMSRPPSVITAGRLWDEGKNIATLDRAAALLKVPVLAAGPLESPFGSMAGLHTMKPLGNLGEADLRGWLAGTPVFCSLALYEPFGLTVLEAAQAGCALVLSDIPTFRELWSGAALFVNPRDEFAAAATLDRVLKDDDLRLRLQARALHRSRHYTADAMARGMAQIANGLLDKPVLSEAAA
jgi:glycosyltransferase involved in cell wall biosynthesis